MNTNIMTWVTNFVWTWFLNNIIYFENRLREDNWHLVGQKIFRPRQKNTHFISVEVY